MNVMPRFFFDVSQGRRFTPDDEGVEFECLEDARREALVTLGAMAKDALPQDVREIVIAVRDGSGPAPLLTFALSVQVKGAADG